MTAAFSAVYARDLRLALRRRVEALLPVVFFVVAVSLFPLGVGPEPQTLRADRGRRGVGLRAAGRRCCR